MHPVFVKIWFLKINKKFVGGTGIVRKGKRVVVHCYLNVFEESLNLFGLVWSVGFYGISIFVGYLTPNPFLCK